MKKYRKKYKGKITKYSLEWRKKNRKYSKEYSKKQNYNKNKHCKCGRKIVNKAKLCKLCELTYRSPKIYIYKGIRMKMGWEPKVAKYLRMNNIKWQYEPKTFKFKNYTYTPDFYLPETDMYIEIKGYWYEKSKQKYLNFKRKYGNIMLFNQKMLKKLGVI